MSTRLQEPFFPIPTAPTPQFEVDALNQALDEEFEMRLQTTLEKTAVLIEQLHQDLFSLGLPDLQQAHTHLIAIHDTLLWLVDINTARMILAQSHNYRTIQEYAEQHAQDLAPLMPLFWYLMSDLQFDEMCSIEHLPNSACSLAEPLACALLKETFGRNVSIPPSCLTTGIAYSIYSQRPEQLQIYLDYCKKNDIGLSNIDFIAISPNAHPLVEDSLTLYGSDGWADPHARLIHLTTGSLNFLQAALLTASTPCIAPILAHQPFNVISKTQFDQALSNLLPQTQWNAAQQSDFLQHAQNTFSHYQSLTS